MAQIKVGRYSLSLFIRKMIRLSGRQENHVGGGCWQREQNKIEICIGCYTDYVDKYGNVLTEKVVPETVYRSYMACNDIRNMGYKSDKTRRLCIGSAEGGLPW